MIPRLVMALILTVAFTTNGFAQPLPCPPSTTSIVSGGADVTICPGACATLKKFDSSSLKSTSSYATSTTTYLPFAFNFGTPVIVNQDDIWSPVITLPFDFCFFGTKYTQLVIGSNGNVSFDITQTGLFCPYTVTPIPTNNVSYNNCIMAPYYDLDPRVNGLIRYATYGIAPCRTFVVSWDSLSTFPCGQGSVGGGCSFIGTQQLVLYETTYAIDIFIKEKSFYSGSTSSGNAAMGIQNATGTQFYTFPGKNGTQWTAQNEGYRFTPNGAPTKTIKWTNLTNGIVVGATDSINVCPPDTTSYELAITFSSQCDSIILKDTVTVNVEKSAVADFSFNINYGCDEDTVTFTNNSVNNSFNIWDFGDATGSTVVDPVHIYQNQNTYPVKLVVGQGNCRDSTTKTVDTQHPLVASFTVDDDSICQRQTVTFTNSSNYTLIGGPATFLWNFGDGTTDTNLSTTHTYNNTGVYNVSMVITDFVPCSDTAFMTILVDSLPSLNFSISDSSLCEGQGIDFTANYTELGNLGITWNFGDGNIVLNQNQISHAYDTAGLFSVTLTGDYRICPDTTFVRDITIRPFPSINLGPDTAMCQGNEAILLSDLTNFSNPAAKYFWNTGDSSASIVARHPGVYTARVTLNGCSASDSIIINKDCYLDIPNSFTPNGDDLNDYFLPRQLLSQGVTKFKMTIYNRWGQEIWQTMRIDGRGWDGRFNNLEQPTGVYIYLIEVTLKNDRVEKYQGNVTLLR